jgi:hypothetical protein
MPALDFPASPTNGQVYGNWIYSSSKGAWQAKPLTSAVATPSDTAPLNPDNGDLWYNTNDGNTYVYYVDGTSNQWVQLKSDATLSSTLGNRVTTLESFPTGLIPIFPASVTTSSGSASVDAQGNVTFTGVTAISLNGVFTSAYENYRIMVGGNWISNVSGTGTGLRFRAAGVDNTSNLYYGQGLYQTGTGGASPSQWSTGNSFHYLSNLHTTGYGITTIDLFSPAQPVRTHGIDANQGIASNVGVYSHHATLHDSAVSYDGFTIITNSANTMTGRVKVYGYR